MADNQLYKIGITHGDLNGIGYEVIIKALADHAIMDICTPVVYGLIIGNTWRYPIFLSSSSRILSRPPRSVPTS